MRKILVSLVASIGVLTIFAAISAAQTGTAGPDKKAAVQTAAPASSDAKTAQPDPKKDEKPAQPEKKDEKPAAAEKKVEKPAAPEKKVEKTEPPANISPDEKAIRLVVDNFVTAYNAGDSQLLADLFTTDGEIISESGNVIKGRDVIQRTFARVFQANPQTKIELAVSSIRIFSPNMAIEDGHSSVMHKPNVPPERNRYMVVYAKQDGRWRMASARDLPEDATSAVEEMKGLGWLIGDWVDESPGSLVTTSYRWSDDHRFIVSEFKVQVGGTAAMTGMQRIGWDPLNKQIHSWMFDSEGGFTEGVWVRNDKRWVIKMTGMTRQGLAASSTNVLTKSSDDRMMWQSRDRVIGNELMKDIGEISVTRQAPKPKQAK